MISNWEVIETNHMIEKENLDVRTITIGSSLLDCIDSDLDKLNENIYNKITTVAKDLVKVGQEIERDYCIPIVNKRISVTPIALVGGAACKTPEDFVTIAKTLDRAAHTVGIIAKVCTYLAENGINILDISQTIVSGFFNMMMIVDLSKSEKEFAAVAEDLENVGQGLGVSVKCQREEIFEMMHRI